VASEETRKLNMEALKSICYREDGGNSEESKGTDHRGTAKDPRNVFEEIAEKIEAMEAGLLPRTSRRSAPQAIAGIVSSIRAVLRPRISAIFLI
jgi:hypothetical protein